MLEPQISIQTPETVQKVQVLSSSQFMTDQQKELKNWIVGITGDKPELIQRQIEEGMVFVSFWDNKVVGFIRIQLQRGRCIASPHGEGVSELIAAAKQRFPAQVFIIFSPYTKILL